MEPSKRGFKVFEDVRALNYGLQSDGSRRWSDNNSPRQKIRGMRERTSNGIENRLTTEELSGKKSTKPFIGAFPARKKVLEVEIFHAGGLKMNPF